MHDFGPPVGPEVRSEIVALAQAIFDVITPKREVRASALAMDDPADPIVAQEVEIKWPDNRLRIAMTEAHARPPFEWFVEITSDVGEADYFKHYLVLEDRVVLAQRKVLTPLDRQEAAVVLADLRAAQAHVDIPKV